MPCARKSNVAELLRLALEHVDERRADDLALLLRIGDAGQPIEEQRRRRRRRCSGSCSRSKRSPICSASSCRSTPLSTKMHVSRSPIARWMSIAATVESTPPLRPQTTRPSPTCARIRAVASSMNDAIVQSPVQPQTSNAKLRRMSLAAIGVRDLGMEQQRVEAAIRRFHRGDRRVGAGRGDREARRRGRRRSRRGSPTPAARRAPTRTAARPAATLDRREAELAVRRRRDLAAERVRHQLHAVADAERRHAGVEHAGVAVRRALFGHAVRPARQDDADRLPRCDRRERRVERQDLASRPTARAAAARSAG